MPTMRCVKSLASVALLFSCIASPASVALTTLSSFAGTNGANPDAGLLQAADGWLYGTTTGGGSSNLGTVFRISPAGGSLVSLASFSGSDGAYPKAGLIQRAGEDFSLFGTASAGGASNYGTVFRISTNGVLSALTSFSGTNGANPQGGLTHGNDGHFYGVTYYGGTNDWPMGYGVVFQVTTDNVLTPLRSFANTNGAEPYATLLHANDGQFYGTTQLGGAAGVGSVFKINTAGALTTLASFFTTNGAFPLGGVVQGTDGHFYGTTLAGGASDLGTVFRVSSNGDLETLISFSGNNGASPFAALIEGSDGNFYGTTAQGGASAFGTVFRITTNGALTTLVHFNSTNGANPYSSLIQGADGSLYGTTGNGGANGMGTVYRVSFPSASLPIIQNISQTGNSLTLEWNATPGAKYCVQYKTNLSDLAWTDWIPSITATNAIMTLLQTPAPESQKFYRVGLLP